MDFEAQFQSWDVWISEVAWSIAECVLFQMQVWPLGEEEPIVWTLETQRTW